jgi:hypothetical protein
MGRRRMLGSIDALLHARIELNKKVGTAELAKIDTLADISSATLTNLDNLPFIGSSLRPKDIHVTGAGNKFLLNGTNAEGVDTDFRLVISGSIMQLQEQ